MLCWGVLILLFCSLPFSFLLCCALSCWPLLCCAVLWQIREEATFDEERWMETLLGGCCAVLYAVEPDHLFACNCTCSASWVC